VFLVTFALAPSAFAQPEAAPGHPWYEVDAQKNVTVNLYLFWASTCPHCPPAVEFARDLQKRQPWAKVRMFEISANPAHRQLYWSMAANLKKPVGPTPAFVYCRHLHNGYVSYEWTGKAIEADLRRWYEALQKHYRSKPGDAKSAEPRKSAPGPGPAAVGLMMLAGLVSPQEPPQEFPEPPIDLPPAGEALNVPVWGEVSAAELSLPAFTAVIAACDAFNPCAFFVLLLLLSVLVHGHSRAQMAFVGGFFVAASGLMYFLFMAAWLNFFVLVGHLRAITLAAGAVAIAAALLNIKDFFWFKRGPSLSIPDSARPELIRRMSRLMASSGPVALVTGTAVLAFTANLYELLCTSGFPMVYTRVLTLRDLPPATYYLYLAAYNVIYVLPMALIVLGFTVTLGSRKLTEYQGRVLKLLSGVMMLALGSALLIRPEWLSHLAGAVGLLLTAVAVTAAAVVVDRLRPARGQPLGPQRLTRTVDKVVS
jgi:hypothetical protein